MRPADVRHVGVVGCGLMGSGIVEVCARAGLRVTFVEGSDELVAAGRGRVERSVGKAVERGKLDAAAAEEALGRIEARDRTRGALRRRPRDRGRDRGPSTRRPGSSRELGTITRPDVVLASNTSSIPIRELGAASGRPENVIGMHFFNPPPVMALLELTPSKDTSEETYEFVRAFGTDILGKTCVRSGDEAGFIVNRLLIPYLFDAIRLFESGFATREDIDAAMRLGLAHPMGPLTLSDLIGLDTLLAIGEVLREAFPEEPKYEAPALLRDLVARGQARQEVRRRVLRRLRNHHRDASTHSHPCGPTVALCVVPGSRSSRSPAVISMSPPSVWNAIDPERQKSTLWKPWSCGP